MISQSYIDLLDDFRFLFPAWYYYDPWSSLWLDQPWLANLFDFELRIDIKSDGIKGVPQFIKISPGRLLVEAGMALTPGAPAGDIRAAYAIVRYGAHFRNAEKRKWLTLPEDCRTIDSRLKSLMSEELGCGITFYVMKEIFEYRNIGDVFSCLKGRKKFIRKLNTEQQPDFCALDKQNCLSFTESKGTSVSAYEMRTQAAYGKIQLSNVEPIGLSPSNNNYVISTYFAINPSTRAGKSQILITDPAADIEGKFSLEVADKFLRLAYAKICRYANNDLAANFLLKKLDWPIQEYSQKKINEPYRPIGIDPLGNIVAFDHKIFSILSKSSTLNLFQELPKEIKRPPNTRSKIFFPDGMVLVHPYYKNA